MFIENLQFANNSHIDLLETEEKVRRSSKSGTREVYYQYKPEFSSTATDFRVILKNVNYIMCGASAHDTAHDAAHDTSVISKQNLLLEFCADPKSRDEMQAYIDVSSRSHFSKYYLKPLLSSGKLEMMFPDKPKSKNQKYTTVHSK